MSTRKRSKETTLEDIFNDGIIEEGHKELQAEDEYAEDSWDIPDSFGKDSNSNE